MSKIDRYEATIKLRYTDGTTPVEQQLAGIVGGPIDSEKLGAALAEKVDAALAIASGYGPETTRKTVAELTAALKKLAEQNEQLRQQNSNLSAPAAQEQNAKVPQPTDAPTPAPTGGGLEQLDGKQRRGRK